MYLFSHAQEQQQQQQYAAEPAQQPTPEPIAAPEPVQHQAPAARIESPQAPSTQLPALSYQQYQQQQASSQLPASTQHQQAAAPSPHVQQSQPQQQQQAAHQQQPHHQYTQPQVQQPAPQQHQAQAADHLYSHPISALSPANAYAYRQEAALAPSPYYGQQQSQQGVPPSLAQPQHQQQQSEVGHSQYVSPFGNLGGNLGYQGDFSNYGADRVRIRFIVSFIPPTFLVYLRPDRKPTVLTRVSSPSNLCREPSMTLTLPSISELSRPSLPSLPRARLSRPLRAFLRSQDLSLLSPDSPSREPPRAVTVTPCLLTTLTGLTATVGSLIILFDRRWVRIITSEHD